MDLREAMTLAETTFSGILSHDPRARTWRPDPQIKVKQIDFAIETWSKVRDALQGTLPAAPDPSDKIASALDEIRKYQHPEQAAREAEASAAAGNAQQAIDLLTAERARLVAVSDAETAEAK